MLTKRAKATAGTIAALTAGVLALSAGPASASGTYSGLAYVYGAGVFIDDWNNEGIVDQSHNTSSNATCLWQTILWSDGFLGTGDIDGIFGSDTANATRQWQNAWTDDTPDGSAGQITWTAAGRFLYNETETHTGNTVSYYDGSLHDFALSRDSNGYYHFYDSTGADRAAGYNYRTCS
ncbi:peptidoglycan-binding protein [Streptomyces sp. NPDC047061]|uniref:peptidoglycan-binding domain-containing protein n=1 Tax=Streptomyces sp. NPDC047061 TaxID=3154605 RepID=UPI0033C6AC4D